MRWQAAPQYWLKMRGPCVVCMVPSPSQTYFQEHQHAYDQWEADDRPLPSFRLRACLGRPAMLLACTAPFLSCTLHAVLNHLVPPMGCILFEAIQQLC